MQSFSSYAFNKAHAAAYSFVAYERHTLNAITRGIFFKPYDKYDGQPDKGCALYCRLPQKRNTVLPPSVNSSGAGFTPTETPYALGF
ncbi:MAG: hypothetical protein ACLR56_04100 [Oscillospiraceae bacterium]